IATYLISLVPLIMIKIPHQRKVSKFVENEPFMKEMIDGFKLIKSIPGLLALICFAMLFIALWIVSHCNTLQFIFSTIKD
ncbi:MAG: hypothetical protein ACFFKA_04620, partial [Candidatus Thorarchaeota archaeon]